MLVGDWPSLWIDAAYLRCATTAALSRSPSLSQSGSPVTADARCWHGGRRVGAETFWTDFLRGLARGLRGVELKVSDAHEGIKA